MLVVMRSAEVACGCLVQEFDSANDQNKALIRRGLDRAESMCLALSFMQGLCEGHRLDWQNILRDQPGSVADIDVVCAVARYLESAQRPLRSRSVVILGVDRCLLWQTTRWIYVGSLGPSGVSSSTGTPGTALMSSDSR